MDTLAFIIKRNAEKFVDDADSDLYKYKRYLEKEDTEESRGLLKAVNTKLGIKTKKIKVSEVREETDYKKADAAKAKLIREEVLEAIKDRFNLDGIDKTKVPSY